MKKYFNLMLAAILICGASVFTSCSKEDNPVEPGLNVAEKIIGKWIVTDKGGQPVLTNNKVVLNFVSTTKVYVNTSVTNNPEVGHLWVDLEESDVIINGNKVTVMHYPNEHKTVAEEYTITSINDNEFYANIRVTVTTDGTTVQTKEGLSYHFVKVTADYSADIIGMWEGMSTGAEGSEFDDGENHRWEYLLDGTFNYFRKVNGEWQISDDDYSEYFVAGDLLCTRWKNAAAGNEEHREWWEIESIENGVMKWKALREREDGTTYTATFEMKKVEISPIDSKCTRAEVVYRIKSPKDNYTFFEGKYAVKSGNEVKKIKKLITFAEEQNEGYNINDITAFPVEEAICLHYGIKDGLESYEGYYSLNWDMSYTVTSYNAKGEELDSQTISDHWYEKGYVLDKEDFERSAKMSYSELHASVAEDGKITLSIVNKMHPERSGIEW
jgi:hypothetical protein